MLNVRTDLEWRVMRLGCVERQTKAFTSIVVSFFTRDNIQHSPGAIQCI